MKYHNDTKKAMHAAKNRFTAKLLSQRRKTPTPSVTAHEVGVEPGLAAVVGVLGDGGGGEVQGGHLGEQGAQAGFVEVGEVAAAAFAAGAAVLERGVEPAVTAQVRRKPCEHPRNLRRRQMQERRVGPDAVEDVLGMVVLEPRADHLLPQIGRRPRTQRWRAVHRHHLVAPRQKGLAVAPRTAAQVENASPRGHTRQKRLLQRAHIGVPRLRHILLGAALVIGQRRRARLKRRAAHRNFSFNAGRSSLSIHSSE